MKTSSLGCMISDNVLIKYGNDAYIEIAMWESCYMTVKYQTHERLQTVKTYTTWFESEIEENNFQGIKQCYELL
jgi:hypothetical protein